MAVTSLSSFASNAEASVLLQDIVRRRGRKRRTTSDQNDSLFSSLAEALRGHLEELLEKGWKLPIYGVAVDGFGNFMTWRYIESDAGVKSRFIAEHLETGGMVAPFSVVHLDGTPGHVAGIVIDAPPRPAN